MQYQRLILFFVCFIWLSSVYAQEEALEFERITAENAEWLVPVEVLGTGQVYQSFWLTNGEKLALQSQAGIYLYDVEQRNGLLEVLPETIIFYSGLDTVVHDPTFQHYLALEILDDIREDSPIQANIWDLRTGEVLGSIRDVEQFDALSPDGMTAAVMRENTIELYDIPTGERITIVNTPAQPYTTNFSHDGHYLIAGGGTSTIDGWYDGYLLIYDLRTQEIIIDSNEDPYQVIYGINFSPDGRYISNGGPDAFWEFDAENLSLSFLGEEPSVLNLSLTRRTYSYENTAVASGELLYFPDGRIWQLSDIYLPNGYFTAVDYYNNRKLLTALADGELYTLPLPNVLGTAFSPDGQTLYYSSSNATFFEPSSRLSGIHLEPRNYYLGIQSRTQNLYRLWNPEGQVSVLFSFDYYGSLLEVQDLRLSDALLNIMLGYHGDFSVSRDRKFLIWTQPIENSDFEYESHVLDLQNQEIRDFPTLFDANFSGDSNFIGGDTIDEYQIYNFYSGEALKSFSYERGDYGFPVFALGAEMRFYAHYQVGQPISIYDVASSELLHQIIIDTNPYFSGIAEYLFISEDEEWLMLAEDNQQRLWRIADLPALNESGTSDLQINFTDGEFELEDGRSMAWHHQDGIHTLLVDGVEVTHFYIPLWHPIFLLKYNYDYQSNPPYTDPSLHYSQNRVYDRISGELLQTIQLSFAAQTPEISLSPDGRIIAMSDNRLALWGIPIPPADPNSVICPNAPTPQLSIGMDAVVTATTGPRELRLRNYPNGIIEASIPSGTAVTIERGPSCANGLLWWGISNAEIGVHGWSAEAISSDDYLLQPMN